MGKTAYNKCIDLMATIKLKGFEKEISLGELTRLIQMEIGADRETITNYIKYLIDFEFMVRNNSYSFELTDKEIKKVELRQLEKETK